MAKIPTEANGEIVSRWRSRRPPDSAVRRHEFPDLRGQYRRRGPSCQQVPAVMAQNLRVAMRTRPGSNAGRRMLDNVTRMKIVDVIGASPEASTRHDFRDTQHLLLSFVPSLPPEIIAQPIAPRVRNRFFLLRQASRSAVVLAAHYHMPASVHWLPKSPLTTKRTTRTVDAPLSRNS
jgi:hypothetical protein